MKLSVSNIAWPAEYDDEMLEFIQSLGFIGLEVAPTRLFLESPYDKLDFARVYAADLYSHHNLLVSSIQSVLFGIKQNFFLSDADRLFLVSYIHKAIDFAQALGCGNIVFGCPKNRVIQSMDQYGIAVDFFRELGEYAISRDTVLAIEPNPVIYGANFINTTAEAFSFVNNVNCPGCRVNVDLGTMIYNGEPLSILEQNVDLIHHIHLSEPNLVPIQPRELHKQLCRLSYNGYLSLEMKDPKDIGAVREALIYMRGVVD